MMDADRIQALQKCGFSLEEQERARDYTRTRTKIALVERSLTLFFILLIGTFLSKPLFGSISRAVFPDWGRDILYTFVVFLMVQCVHAFPRLQKYRADLRYELTLSSPHPWGWGIAGALLGSVLGTVLFTLLYAVSSPIWQGVEWDSPAAVFFYLTCISLSQGEFGRPEEWKQLSGPEWERVKELAKKIGVKPPRVTVVESPERRKAWAMFFTWSLFERIYLSRPLLDRLTPGEADAVIAHELAHKRYEAIQLLLFYAVWGVPAIIAVSAGLPRLAGALGLDGGVELLPLFMFFVDGTLLAIKPLTNAVSRWIERKADRLALTAVDDPKAFATAMIKLHDHNLIFAAPGRLWQFFFGTHPTGVERIQLARRTSKTS